MDKRRTGNGSMMIHEQAAGKLNMNAGLHNHPKRSNWAGFTESKHTNSYMHTIPIFTELIGIELNPSLGRFRQLL